MTKGFISFRNGRILFVIEDYRMELFTDDDLLKDFCKDYNFKKNYILEGQCFNYGGKAQKSTFLVEHSTGSTCYLRCYIVYMVTNNNGYDKVGFQSPFLDDIFKYRYNYLDIIRAGINLSVTPNDVYELSFSMDNKRYHSIYRIGYDNRLGLLEDFDRKGELIVPVHSDDILECYNLLTVLSRFAMFMTSQAQVQFKRITLYKGDWKAGWFYCPLVSETAISGIDMIFYELDVLKYVPKILNNIALDSGNKITKSVPLGHLENGSVAFSPQRFVEQIMAFEYLFDKLEPQKAQNKNFPLKKELELMFDRFPKLLSGTTVSAGKASEQIKELRRTIAHGYAYYYDFKNDTDAQYLVLLMDKLIKNMSLLWIGFTDHEIEEYPVY